MDPLSIASTVIGVTATCLSTTKKLYALQGKFKNAPVTVVSICSESTVIGASLSQIQSLLIQRQDLADVWKTRTDVSMALDTALTGCLVLYSCLDREVLRITANAAAPGKLSWRSVIRTVWNESNLQELLSALRGQQTAINLLIQLLQMDTLTDIRHILEKNQTTIGLSKHITQSLRDTNPAVDVATSIYDTTSLDNQTIIPDNYSTMAPSELEFEFDDMIINSQVYRRVVGHAIGRSQTDIHDETHEDLIDFSDSPQGLNNSVPEGDTAKALSDLQVLTIHDDRYNSNTEAPPRSSLKASEIMPLNEGMTSSSEKLSPFSSIRLAESQPSKAELQKQGDPETTRICLKCQEAITGGCVRIPQTNNMESPESSERMLYHASCFTCNDCGVEIATSFYRWDNTTGTTSALCETDYFKRLDLKCMRCGKPIMGSYAIGWDGNIYHAEHFTCSAEGCTKIFGQEDAYFEHDGKPHCLLHYCKSVADICPACNIPILGDYVDFAQGSDLAGAWHPFCYLIKKLSNVEVSSILRNVPTREGNDWFGSNGKAMGNDDLASCLDEVERQISEIWADLPKSDEDNKLAASVLGEQ